MENFDWFKTELRTMLQEELPGMTAHQRMMPGNRPTLPDVEGDVSYRKSAVMALMYPDQGQISLLYIQRPTYEGHHSGQIAFPGGKMENADSDLLDTALRETHEEIGISRSEIEVLGEISPVVIPVSKYIVHPFVGWMNELPLLTLQQEEVAETLHFGIRYLLDPSNEVQRPVSVSSGIKMKVPCFEFDESIVWGATALMTSEIAHLLRLSEKVKNNI